MNLLRSAAVDVAIGLTGTVAVILATDALGADLRIFLGGALALFFGLGLWRGGSEGASAPVRALLVVLPALAWAVEPVVRRWPPEARDLAYYALLPAAEWIAAAAGLALRSRGKLGARRLATALGGAALVAALVSAATMPSFVRWLNTDATIRPAPAISFETFDGEPVDSAAWRGRVVVLDLWASWCLPCRVELVELEELRSRFRDDDDVVFWAVATRDERAAAERFAAESPLDLPWAFDPGNAAYEALQAVNIPSLYLIDRQGRIRLTHVGYSAAEGLAEHLGARLEALVAEPAP